MSADVDLSALTDRFVAAQLAGDRREALRLVVDEGVARGVPVVEVQARVIREAQARIGRLWQANRINVAAEHLATGISQVVMARLFEHVEPGPRNGRTVAVACVEGELHDFPARLVADYLDHAGFHVRFLGASVPTDDLLASIRVARPDLLALSATMSFHAAALRAAVDGVRSVDAELPILLGGHALSWSPKLAHDLRVDVASAEPSDIVAAAERLTGLR